MRGANTVYLWLLVCIASGCDSRDDAVLTAGVDSLQAIGSSTTPSRSFVGKSNGTDYELTATIPRLRLIEEVRLDGEQEDFSSIITTVLVGPRGQIAVVDPWRFGLLFYDSAGQYMGHFGRSGDGPGEFKSGRVTRAGAMASLDAGTAGDTIWVYDYGNRRLTFVTWDRQLVRSVAISGRQWGTAASSAQPISFQPVAVLPDGSMLGTGTLPSVRPGSAPPAALLHATPAWSKFTIVAQSPGDAKFSASLRRADGGIHPVSALFQSNVWKQSVSQSGDQILVASQVLSGNTETLILQNLSPSGDTIGTLRISGPGIPLDASLARRRTAELISDYRGAKDVNGNPMYTAGEIAKAERALVDAIPKNAPTLVTVIAGFDGTATIAKRIGADSLSYVVLDRDRVPIGELRIRNGTGLMLRVSPTHIWRTEYNDDGIAQVVRYRMVVVE